MPILLRRWSLLLDSEQRAEMFRITPTAPLPAKVLNKPLPHMEFI
ncbi:MAG TPA: hypothetical protein VJB38_07410 [Bacteroidota bacterium]|nr:hypothetical protein [Bacteroidota bacterium]